MQITQNNFKKQYMKAKKLDFNSTSFLQKSEITKEEKRIKSQQYKKILKEQIMERDRIKNQVISAYKHL